MKIAKIFVGKEKASDGSPVLALRVETEDGEQYGASGPDAADIETAARVFRGFAHALENMAANKAA
jgi:hypothetical protein